MAAKVLPYGKQLIEDDDVAAVIAALKSDFLTQGPAVPRFEAALCEATGAKYAIAVANGTAALHLAALAAGVRAGDYGVTSDITFVASANAIRYAGGASLLADVDPETSLVSVASMAARVAEIEALGKKPKVLIPVDMTGAVAPLAEVRALADRVGALVIEDAAHSLGATYTHGGVTYRAGCGQHAHMATLSFHPVKTVTTGEGGAIVTNDDALAAELRDLRTHGITKDAARLEKNDGPWYYEQRTLGFNYRISDIQCALGESQMKKLGRFVDRRRAIAARYDAAFADPVFRGKLAPLRVPEGQRSAYHLYVVRVLSRAGEALAATRERRRAVFEHLRERSILPQIHYIPVHTQPDFRRAGLSEGAFPGADAYYAGCLSLPMFPLLGDDDVDRVVDTLRDAPL